MDAWNKDYSDIKNYKTVHIESYSCNERLPQSQNEDHILEQRSATVDVPTRPSEETQREAVGVINTMPDLNQDSNIKNGADDICAYRGAKAPIMKSKHEDDVVFFGDSNTTEPRPTTRTTLDQDGLHRGSISTLPSAKKKRLSNATQPTHTSPVEDSQNPEPEQTLTEKAYAAAAGVAAGVASFFVGQRSYDEDSIQASDASKDQSQDNLLSNPPILTPQADKLVAEEQQPAVHQLVNVPDIQEPVNPVPPTINVEEPRNEPSPLLTAPPIDDSASAPSTNRVSTISDHAISDNTTADDSAPHASLEVLVPAPVGTCIDSKESLSSTHVVTNGMVPPPANVSEPKRKNSLPEKLKKAFRRLSLKDGKSGKQRHMSDAEIFKNQMIQQQMSGHPASVVSRPAGEMRRQSSEHLKYTGVDKKYSRVPGVYSLNRVAAEDNTKGSFVSGHLEQRRGSLQKMVGKITKNNSMMEKGEQAEISGKEKINAYKATKKVAA